MTNKSKKKIIEAWGILYKGKYLQFSTLKHTKKEVIEDYGCPGIDIVKVQIILKTPALRVKRGRR